MTFAFNPLNIVCRFINHVKTMSLLGKMRANLLSEDDADICKVRLMNQLCEVSTVILDRGKNSQTIISSSNESIQEMA